MFFYRFNMKTKERLNHEYIGYRNKLYITQYNTLVPAFNPSFKEQQIKVFFILIQFILLSCLMGCKRKKRKKKDR